MSDQTKQVLLFVGDGPEHIEIYTSEDQAVVDWAKDCPALYLTVTCGMNSAAQFGPFDLSASLIKELLTKLKEASDER